ncbi:MAG TPA: hypothetical protein VIG64_09595 [Actinomycetota bacterium]
MADEHIERLLDHLETSFDAGVARAEDEAAADLALSLLQDATLSHALQRDGAASVLLAGGGSAAVTEVGSDYLMCGEGGDIVVPLARATVAGTSGPPPSASGSSLLVLLRELVRHGATVEVTSSSGSYRGRLAAAAHDHVVVAAQHGASGQRRWYVAQGSIEVVRVLRGAW